MYIELFTYWCRQSIKLALYTHLNSAIKCFVCQNIGFVACPIIVKWLFWRNEWQTIHMYLRSIDKSGIIAESRTKGKEYYGIGIKERCKQLQLKYSSNVPVCKVISVKCVNKVHMYFWTSFSPSYIVCTKFQTFFLGYSCIDMGKAHKNCIIDLVRQRSPSDGSGSELRYWVGFFGVVSLPLKTAFGTIGNCRLRLY